MRRFLQELISEERPFTVDVIGTPLQQAEVVEVDEVGLLTLQGGCLRCVPWTSIHWLVVNVAGGNDGED